MDAAGDGSKRLRATRCISSNVILAGEVAQNVQVRIAIERKCLRTIDAVNYRVEKRIRVRAIHGYTSPSSATRTVCNVELPGAVKSYSNRATDALGDHRHILTGVFVDGYIVAVLIRNVDIIGCVNRDGNWTVYLGLYCSKERILIRGILSDGVVSGIRNPEVVINTERECRWFTDALRNCQRGSLAACGIRSNRVVAAIGDVEF